MKTYQINSVTDLLSLDRETFLRFIPDLIAWYSLMQEAIAAGAEADGGMKWIDDGRVGEIHSTELRIKETGEVMVIKGTAYSEAA